MDTELFKALKKNDEYAWEEAFKLLYPSVFIAAQHPLASLTPSEAEDIAIETLTLIVEKVGQVKSIEQLKALSITIALRKAISLQRKKYAEKRGSNQVDSLEDLKERSNGKFEPTAFHWDSLSETDLMELAELLKEALSSLGEPSHGIINDLLIHQLSYKDISEKYKVPMGTVGVILTRGMEKIRNRLGHSPKLLKELSEFLR